MVSTVQMKKHPETYNKLSLEWKLIKSEEKSYEPQSCSIIATLCIYPIFIKNTTKNYNYFNILLSFQSSCGCLTAAIDVQAAVHRYS